MSVPNREGDGTDLRLSSSSTVFSAVYWNIRQDFLLEIDSKFEEKQNHLSF